MNELFGALQSLLDRLVLGVITYLLLRQIHVVEPSMVKRYLVVALKSVMISLDIHMND